MHEQLFQLTKTELSFFWPMTKKTHQKPLTFGEPEPVPFQLPEPNLVCDGGRQHRCLQGQGMALVRFRSTAPGSPSPPLIPQIWISISLFHHFMGVQWPRLQAPNAGGPASIPSLGTRSHMPQPRLAQSDKK